MPIEWSPEARQLNLANARVGYVMRVADSGRLEHLHFGARLETGTDYAHLSRRSFITRASQVLDPFRMEVPTSGGGDYRVPALSVELADGSGVLDLVYREHHVSRGKPGLPGLPATYVEDDAEADHELDPTTLPEEERARVRDQVAWYKERREILQRGRFIRLRGPYDDDGNETAWMSVSPDRGRALVGWYRVLAHTLPGPSFLRLRGLDPGVRYRVRLWPEADDTLVRVNELDRGGDDLMRVGLLLDDHAWESQVRGDFQARIFDLERLPG